MQTIGELAKSLNVSKTAIHNKLRDLGIKDDLQKVDGAYYLTDEQAEKVAQSIKKRPAVKYTEKKTTKKGESDEENRKVNSKVIELLERRIDAQEKQIEKKDAQIDALQKEQARLHDLLDQQQKLTLIAEQKALALEDKQHKGILSRLFHRSKPTEQPQEPQQEKTGEGADV